MKTIGLLGGRSWASTEGYYRAINTGVREALGGLHSAKIALHSADFQPIEQLQHRGDWAGTAEILIAGAKSVEAVILSCTEIGLLISQRDAPIKLLDITLKSVLKISRVSN